MNLHPLKYILTRLWKERKSKYFRFKMHDEIFKIMLRKKEYAIYQLVSLTINCPPGSVVIRRITNY